MTEHAWEPSPGKVNFGCHMWHCRRCGDYAWKKVPNDASPPTPEDVAHSGGVPDCDVWLIRDVQRT